MLRKFLWGFLGVVRPLLLRGHLKVTCKGARKNSQQQGGQHGPIEPGYSAMRSGESQVAVSCNTAVLKC